MSANATTFSNLRRFGLKQGGSARENINLNRYKSSSQDILDEKSIKSRLDEELNWLEGSRPGSRSIENLLGDSRNATTSRIPSGGNVEEKKKKLISAGLFSTDDIDQLDRSGNRFRKVRINRWSSSESEEIEKKRETGNPGKISGILKSESFPPPPPELRHSQENIFYDEVNQNKLYDDQKKSSIRTFERLRDRAAKSEPFHDIPSGTEGSEYSFRSSTINNPEVDTRVEAMEAKLAELSKKFEQITTTPSSDERSESDRRNSNKELSKLHSENTNLQSRLDLNEKSKSELARKYTKCLDRIYDLEKELESAQDKLMVKDEQLIKMRESAENIYGHFSELRAEITSARRAQIDMRRSMQNEVQAVQTNIITLLDDYDTERQNDAPRVSDFGSDTLNRLQQDRGKLEKSKAEYSNEADLINETLADVEKNVEEMRNDAVEKRSKISRKGVESIALQLCNVAGRVTELKDKLPVLDRIVNKVGTRETDAIQRENYFIQHEPSRLEETICRVKALTVTLSTLKKLAGVQEARNRGTGYEDTSLQRNYRTTDNRDRTQMLTALLREIHELNPIDHSRRVKVIQQWEPRWAMQRYRNMKYETAKFEKALEICCRELQHTNNIRMIEVRQEERIRELYLTQKQETKDLSMKQTSNGGQNLPFGGGTLPKTVQTKVRSPITHHKQRSWDPIESGMDDLKVSNAIPYATYRPQNAQSAQQYFSSDTIEKMAAISSPNLVRATMHMRGELHKTKMIHTKSNPHLLEDQLYGSPKLRIESKGKMKERPASMFNSSDDYGPLIIDSVVQQVPTKDPEPQQVTESSDDKNKQKSPAETKSKFGFGLRKSVFSRSKKDEKEKPSAKSSPTKPCPPKSPPAKQPTQSEESPTKSTLPQFSPGSLQKKSFASRMASFSKRKNKAERERKVDERKDSDDEKNTPNFRESGRDTSRVSKPTEPTTAPNISYPRSEASTVYSDGEIERVHPKGHSYGIMSPKVSQKSANRDILSANLSPRPYRTPTNPKPQVRSPQKTNNIPSPQYTKSPPVRFEHRFQSTSSSPNRPQMPGPASNTEWSKPERRTQNNLRSPTRFGYAQKTADRMKTSDV